MQEVRRFIEAGCATLAASRRTDHHLTVLKEILLDMEASFENEEESEQADIRFHMAIAKASQNTLFIGMMEILDGATASEHEGVPSSLVFCRTCVCRTAASGASQHL